MAQQQRPLGITILAVLAFIGGIFGICGGLSGIVAGSFLSGLAASAGASNAAALGGMAAVYSIVALGFAVADLVFGFGAWTLNPGRVPVVRWPTTIGGWQEEKLDGGAIDQRWKESPVGPRVWRELFVGPTWLPPDTTPHADLVRSLGGGHHVLSRELMGPSYRSAYGLVMLVHERVGKRRGKPTYDDQGVRTHGSGSIGSIFDGRSHGCHRLLPAQALRLAGFLLRHRAHVRHGETATLYRRVFKFHGRYPVRITTRGYVP